MNRRASVCVVGAGVVGLSAALQLQEAGFKVQLLADKFDRDTTSDGAAGMFNPRVVAVSGTPKEVTQQWFRDSFTFFDRLATSEAAPQAGVQFVSGYEFYVEIDVDEDQIYNELYYNIRECSPREYRLFRFEGIAKKGFFYTSLMIEGRWFLPWLMDKFMKAGGNVIKKKLKSLKELAGQFDVVVNCAGLGSNELLGDKETFPIRGQVIRAKAPWIKHFFVVDGYQSYIFPGKETVVVGGTYQKGDWDLQVRKEDTERIWKTACHHMPYLNEAEWQWQWVGLRPGREPLRLEAETMYFGDSKLEVVHNYGHGGNGIALSWGTGMRTLELVEEVLRRTANKAS